MSEFDYSSPHSKKEVPSGTVLILLARAPVLPFDQLPASFSPQEEGGDEGPGTAW